MPVPPEAVWEVLADAGGYGRLQGGPGHRPRLPAPGTRFHHTIGFGPVTLRDHTEVLEAEAPRCLRLRAKGRPAGQATVTLRLTPVDGGTAVEMVEHPAGPFGPLALNPLVHVATRLRNGRSLMRLEDLARAPERRVSSVWLDTAPEAPAFPALEEHLTADVCVVGGGIVGVTTALVLHEAGARVVLVEADRIGDRPFACVPALHPERSYAIACRIAGAPPEGMFISAGGPSATVRAPGGR
jgi:uncharacterized protein YndB with AHSA1/START domain